MFDNIPMKQSSGVISECDYSFEMLYKAAFGRNLDSGERKNLQSLSQEEINMLVISWASQAHWKTEKRLGEDGKVYFAFHP